MLIDLGLIDYEECYAIQKDVVRRRRAGVIGDTLILAEHNEIFTIGRTGSMDNLLIPEDMLLSNALKVLRVDRGGDITFHGPGQLVVYPVIDLKDSCRDLHSYLRSLEEVGIRFLNEYGINAERVPGKTGVWVSGKKIASVGVGASNWVTFHGLSMNINCSLKFFSMINPCGIKDVEMTSLERLKGQKVCMDGAKKNMVMHFKEVFGLDTNEYSYKETALA